ncbi:right-handed parallel beta-helix repeat-containing protein [Streptomyces atriruber]|uniref:right-handed parallel beta-helix repeat-containing protein n=1 Tax=Streptomyces atriruber TaxID=545121 RepID=UPI000B1CC3F3|nr:right-handed parallel beta-helix repeat-containing protein [Streptomyces atriruber]
MTLRRTSIVAAVVLAAAAAPSAPAASGASAFAASASVKASTYYVDCAAGDDSSSGTSAGAAWRTVARASGHTFGPGDRLLLKRGTSCTGVLAPKGAGAAGAPVRIDAYGGKRAAKPRIEGGGARAALHLVNTEQWEIRNLDLSNTGPATTTERRAGLYVRLTDYGVARHFVVDGVDVHDVNGADFKDPDPSGGILFTVQGTAKPTRFDGVRVQNSTVRHVDRTGIATSSTWGRDVDGANWLSTGVQFRRNKVDDVGGDGIVVQKARGALAEHNYVDGFNMRSGGYNAGLWAWQSDDVVYQYNEVTGGHGTRDSMAYDIDGGNNRNVYRYNYSHDNEGGFLLVCNAEDTVSDGNRVHDNISINDRNTASPYAVISVVCGASTDTQVYRNTVVTDRSDTALVSNNGPSGVTFRDNIFVGAPGTGSPIKDTVSTYEGNLYWNTAQPRDPKAVNADPRLVSTAPRIPGDVRLKAGSPARGAGTPTADGTTHDYFGNPIPNPPNIGADQSGRAPGRAH